jgi:hypothetical protein
VVGPDFLLVFWYVRPDRGPVGVLAHVGTLSPRHHQSIPTERDKHTYLRLRGQYDVAIFCISPILVPYSDLFEYTSGDINLGGELSVVEVWTLL